MHPIITRGLYTFYPIFENIFLHMSLGLNSLPVSCVRHVWFIRELLAIEIRETLPVGQKIGKFEPQKVKNRNILTKKGQSNY